MPFLVKNILRGSVAALFLATFAGCSNTHNGFTLSGRFADRASQKVTLLYCTFHATDTIGMATLSTDGSFSFEGNLAEPSICVLRIGTDDLLFLLDNVEMTLQSDTFTNHSTLQIDGYQRAEHFNKAVLLDKNRIKLYNSTEKELQQRITKGDTTMTVAAMHRQLAALDQLFRANLKQYVTTTTDPIIGLYLLHLLSAQQDFAYMNTQYYRLRTADSTSIYMLQFGKRMQRAQGILTTFAPNELGH